MRFTVEPISELAKVQLQQESVRSDGSKGGLEEGNTNSEEYGRGGSHWYAGTDTGDAQVGG